MFEANLANNSLWVIVSKFVDICLYFAMISLNILPLDLQAVVKRYAFLVMRISMIQTRIRQFEANDLSPEIYCIGAYRFHHFTVHADTSAGSNQFQHLFIKISQIYYDLQIIYCRTVIQCDKVYLLSSSLCR